jgi:glycogen synthase
VFSKIDANPTELLTALRSLLESNLENGAVVNVFAQQNAGVLAGRSHNLWQLANALLIARDYPARDLVTAFENKEDLRQPFKRLREEIDVILQTIVSWEDYQSAVNLLRQLLDRQRGLYLRTQEAVL